MNAGTGLAAGFDKSLAAFEAMTGWLDGVDAAGLRLARPRSHFPPYFRNRAPRVRLGASRRRWNYHLFPLVGTVVVSAQAGLSPGSVQCRVVLIYPDGSTNTTQLSI